MRNAGFLTQTFQPVELEEGRVQYKPAVLKGVVERGDHPDYAELSDDRMRYHFAGQLHVDYEILIGRRLRPAHVFYWSPAAGYQSGGNAYAIGAFGDGGGLPAGTVYAVLEIHNPAVEQKFVAIPGE